MSFFADIHAALDTRLNSLAGGVAIAWENTEYTPVKDTPYLRPTLLMAPSTLMDLDTLQMNEGLYQIDLFYPVANGMGDLLNKMDAIYDHFKGALKLTSGSVDVHIKQISRLPGSEISDAWLMASLEINFKSYSN